MKYRLTKLFKEIIQNQGEIDAGKNPKFTIFVDMDGTITDFDKHFTDLVGKPPKQFEQDNGIEEFWRQIDKVHGVKFWSEMPWLPEGKRLWNYVQKHGAKLLSSPSRSSSSRLGKRKWVQENIPGTKLILARRPNKQNYSGENRILIDDRQDTIDEWNSRGGIGILFTDTQSVIDQLLKLGL